MLLVTMTCHDFNKLWGKNHSILTDGHEFHQTMNHICALRICLLRAWFPLQNLKNSCLTMSYCFLVRWFVNLILKQITLIKLFFRWIPHYQQLNYQKNNCCEQKLFTWAFFKTGTFFFVGLVLFFNFFSYFILGK